MFVSSSQKPLYNIQKKIYFILEREQINQKYNFQDTTECEYIFDWKNMTHIIVSKPLLHSNYDVETLNSFCS